MRRVQVFDVNETLLDLAAMDAHFERVFGDAGLRRVWFTQMIQSALVAIITGAYSQFGAHALAALEMLADQTGIELADGDRQAISGQMRRLPAHPEVPAALERLRGAGFQLAALTNSTLEVAGAQLEHAGLIDLFDQVLSADTVRRLKPAPEPYRMAADRFGVGVGQVRLIAAHAWDVAGARHAGCAAAFVARPGKALDPLAEAPDVIGGDLDGVEGDAAVAGHAPTGIVGDLPADAIGVGEIPVETAEAGTLCRLEDRRTGRGGCLQRLHDRVLAVDVVRQRERRAGAGPGATRGGGAAHVRLHVLGRPQPQQQAVADLQEDDLWQVQGRLPAQAVHVEPA